MLSTPEAPEVREESKRTAAEAAQASEALHKAQEFAGVLLRSAERCIGFPEYLRKRWKDYEAKSPAGTPESLAPVFESFREVVANALEATEGVRGASGAFAQIGLFPKDVAASVQQAEEELRCLLEEHDKLWAWVGDSGPMTFDEEMSRQSREAYARGEHEDLGDIIKRLQAGGEL